MGVILSRGGNGETAQFPMLRLKPETRGQEAKVFVGGRPQWEKGSLWPIDRSLRLAYDSLINARTTYVYLFAMTHPSEALFIIGCVLSLYVTRVEGRKIIRLHYTAKGVNRAERG